MLLLHGVAMRRLVRRVNRVTLFLWVLAAALAAVLVAEYVSRRI